ncbi:helix-turn-helix domain-containing protein [Roseofilum reptotaenium CS-1145]|uniref:Uncharacterized protein n=1 Tax=Roseofilum reptotaenium AO1-A TaxID=1925591 RepID=A0A1L9QP90_9CYAN|nr:helix-turn-helix domain-containing protein [Roseofilum reptotaenium]MDB9516456.1 helix-turn-helix domain-containing protein [Roseofilum reptotaenium CS-1145]OJJ24469.1 hypothetical protein BI308_16755 [Roseofilum reptotaenium AO1-A]
MAGRLKVSVSESVGELQNRLSKSKTASEKERLQMLYWLKIGKVSTRKELSQRLCRNEATITRWLRKYGKGRIRELLEVKKAPGKERKIKGELLEKLSERLNEPKGFNSYGEIQEWLQEKQGEIVKYKTVHKTVRYKLGGKLKTPRPRSVNQHKEAEETFKKKSNQP